MVETMGTARLIVETLMKVKAGEEVLVVADDYARPKATAEAIGRAAKSAGAFVIYMIAPPRHIAGEDQRRAVAAAMRNVDAIFGAGERVNPIAGHSSSHEELFRAGVRMKATIGVSEDYLRRPISLDDIYQIRERTERVAQIYTEAETIKLTTSLGTSLSMSIKGRHGTALNPITGILVPDYAEAAVPPVEGSTEGVIVFEGEMDGWGCALTQPLRLTVKKGRVVEVTGDPGEVERLQQIISTDENSNNVGEFAIGTSHTVPKMFSGTRYDFGILGYVHIGLGRNTVLGGETLSKTHIDGIMTKPTVEVDGKRIIEEGTLLT